MDKVTHVPGSDEISDQEECKKFHLPETERDISKQLCPQCSGRIDDAMTATMIDIRNRLNVLEALGELIDDDYDPDVPTGTEIRDQRANANDWPVISKNTNISEFLPPANALH